MEYRNKIVSEFRQLEDYARTCFVRLLKLPNGQGKAVNEFVDQFMQDLTDGELAWGEQPRRGEQITLDGCIYELLPQCRVSEKPENTYLWVLVGDWIHDNLHKCDRCGTWYNMEKDGYNCGLCPDCTEEDAQNDPDTIADFLNDLEADCD